eukprot:6458855-Amphidinium_carterae.1
MRLQDLTVAVIWDHTEWFSKPHKWRPPSKHETPYAAFKGIVAAAGEECSLMVAAARNAFGMIPKTGLKRICTLLAVTAEGAGLYDQLEALVRALLPSVSDEEVLSIMSQRCTAPDDPDIVLDDADLMREGLDKTDQEEVKVRAQKSEGKSESTDFLRRWGKEREKIRPSHAKERKTSDKRLKGKTATTIGVNREYPKRIPTVLDANTVQSLMPPPVTAWIDYLENRVRAKYEGMASISRSWAVRGEQEALRLVVEWAWQLHKTVTDQDCPIEGV